MEAGAPADGSLKVNVRRGTAERNKRSLRGGNSAAGAERAFRIKPEGERFGSERGGSALPREEAPDEYRLATVRGLSPFHCTYRRAHNIGSPPFPIPEALTPSCAAAVSAARLLRERLSRGLGLVILRFPAHRAASRRPDRFARPEPKCVRSARLRNAMRHSHHDECTRMHRPPR